MSGDGFRGLDMMSGRCLATEGWKAFVVHVCWEAKIRCGPISDCDDVVRDLSGCSFSRSRRHLHGVRSSRAISAVISHRQRPKQHNCELTKAFVWRLCVLVGTLGGCCAAIVRAMAW